ncbi:MAG: hypothetical protein J6D52_08445, partial [Clostridia bacterium]|nr:hypothetical protein [Clostridia bacterium]
MGVHDGHRKRFKAEFIEKGITAATPPHKILELLLYFCVVQKDTNVLAHELFNKYGSVAAVLDAPIEELAEFKGLSKESALLFKIINPIAGYCQSEKIECMYELSGPDKIGKYMLSKFFGLQNERMAILFIDAFGRNMGFEFVSEWEVDKVIVPIRKILKAAINSGA